MRLPSTSWQSPVLCEYFTGRAGVALATSGARVSNFATKLPRPTRKAIRSFCHRRRGQLVDRLRNDAVNQGNGPVCGKTPELLNATCLLAPVSYGRAGQHRRCRLCRAPRFAGCVHAKHPTPRRDRPASVARRPNVAPRRLSDKSPDQSHVIRV
jgi:hypothetical protein